MNSTSYDAVRDAAQPASGGKVVTVTLVARESDWEFVQGMKTRVWAYNGQVPGPTLEAHVGDVLQVTLKNELPEPTTIHWHGLRLPAAMDGTQDVQSAITPGDSFTYRFLLPDAGTFWYHPHFDETVQLERGLYGALLVRGHDEPRFDQDRVLVLDDVKLDRSGQIEEIGGFAENHDGRQGRTLLVNGRQGIELLMSAGQVERWRIVNAASARYFRLSFGRRQFALIATDGGFIEAPVQMSEVLVVPGDRVELAVGPFAEGERVRLETLPYDRRTIARSRTEVVANVLVERALPSRASIPRSLRRIEPLVTGPVAATREVHLGVRPSLRHGVKFVVNGEAHHHDRPVQLGELQVWDLVNDTLMDHPFHLHGYFFQVVSIDDTPPGFRSWEDTLNIPPRSRVRIAWMPDDRAGEWMYHCHILEHHASGMMAHFRVES
jgi:FtsP/CotA-like multicopper oxidase with cupredoxin domain